MTKKEAKKYAKTKHKGLPEKVEEATDCGPTEIERDTRGDYAKINLIKNKLRAKGAKDPIIVMSASYEPEGNIISERERGDEPDEKTQFAQSDAIEAMRRRGTLPRRPKPGTGGSPASQAKPAD
jgi:hypothetical protein